MSDNSGMDAIQAETAQLLGLLNKYETELLSTAWVEGVIDTDYTECEALPARFEEQHIQTNWISLLTETGRVCRSVVQQTAAPSDTSADASVLERSSAPSGFWTALAESGTQHKHVISLLFYFMYSGQKSDASFEERQAGMLAASVYLDLLAIPGSNAFRVFHPVLYSRALDSFKLLSALTARRGGGARRPSRAAEDELGVEEDEEEVMEPAEAARLLRLLAGLLGDLLLLTERFSLRHGAESLEDTVQTLVEITRADGVRPELTHNAFCCLTSICRPLHGSVTRSVALVLRALIPALLMVGEQPPRALTAGRDLAVRFVGQLVRSAGVLAEPALQTLVQNVCLRVPERAEQRQRGAQAVMRLLRLMPLPLYTQTLRWLRDFARHEKTGHRLFALEVLSQLLAEGLRGSTSDSDTGPGRRARRRSSRRSPTPDSTSESDPEDWEAAQRRESAENAREGGRESRAGGRQSRAGRRESRDGERGSQESRPESQEAGPESQPEGSGGSQEDGERAMTHAFLVRLIFAQCRDPAATVRARALNVLAECTVSADSATRAAVRRLFTAGARRPSAERQEGSGAENEENEEQEDIMAMLRRRAKDSKVMVRKSSLQVIENIMRLNPSCVTPENLQVLLEHCRDPALLARKQCQSSLIGLVTQYPADDGVCEAVVRGLLPQIHDPENKVQERVIQFVDQTILAGIRPFEEGALSRPDEQLPWKLLDLIVKFCFQKYLHTIMQAVFSGQKIKPGVFRALRSHVGTANNAPAWMCLALISRFAPVEQPLFALDYFTEQIQNELMTEEVFALQQSLHVLQFSAARLSPEAATRLQTQLTGLLRAAALPVELLSAAVDTVAMVTLERGGEDGYQQRLEEWCGPLIEDCEDFLSKELLQPGGGQGSLWEDRLLRQIHTLGDLAQLVPQRVNKRCFLMLQNIIYVEKNGRRGASGGLQDPSARLRSVAIATLGKLCLQHEQMAKRVVPALGKILDVTEDPAIKNNVVFTLSDMCVRYATLVDPLMPQVTCCLKDRSLVVRRNTLILLIRLLQEDYLKLKGTFFFRLIQCLLDPEPEIRQLIRFYLTERLLKRQPKVFFQHFVECLFLYNEYEDHESYNKLAQTAREREVFSLKGPEQRPRRMLVYKFMLEHMPDDQRFQMSHKLCQDILGGVVDGKIALSAASVPLLRDTLALLSCDEIKLQSLKTSPEDAEPATDASGMAEVFQAVAKKTLISQVVKKNVIENMVPIIIALKHKLETARSPLLKELMIYLKDLMKDYKNEIQDILVADKQLAKEIEFDMKRLSEAAEGAGDGDGGEGAPPPPATPRPATTPSNRRIQSVLVEAIRSAHRMTAGRPAAAAEDGQPPPEEPPCHNGGGEGGRPAADGSPELAAAAPAPAAAPAGGPERQSPGLGSPTRDLREMLRAISTPQADGAAPNLTFVDRDVSAILRLSPIVRVSSRPPGAPDTPAGGGDGAPSERRKSARRGLVADLAAEAIQEQDERA
ncbi:condensin-2 complex subunit D3-like [Amphibalanus amphitrite]|uniref:condensin-2 complex subunit D3-like n=1 Tax=Amphibalanus amphitrite TaxID=1232801 RepID=UPI001C914C96|nr:condensin-2 complex subunit D3-like [Amphibalanus amphitrite]XP_043235558.1 condensin-2 complex subunit D3-like [Amphibalanus amphitrite]